MTDAAIELLLDFLGTVEDPLALSSPQRLGDWLSRRELLPETATVSQEDLRNARHLRAALIALLAERGGAPPDARTRTTIAVVMQASPLRVEVANDGTVALVPVGGGVDAALARILSALHSSTLTGEFERLKTCPRCGGPFYDASKNRSRVWCDMAKCGSVEKARTYRARRASQ